MAERAEAMGEQGEASTEPRREPAVAGSLALAFEASLQHADGGADDEEVDELGRRRRRSRARGRSPLCRT